MKIGVAIAQLRRDKGMTQQELAKAAGMFQGRISKIETGAHSPHVSTLLRLARATDAKR